jgi:adenine nucleotide transporter 17
VFSLRLFPHRIKTRIQTEVTAIEEAVAAATAPTPAQQQQPSLKRPHAPLHLPHLPHLPHPLHKHTTARQMAVKILKEGGALAFYRGFGANMLNTFSMQLWVFSSRRA